MTDLSLSLSQVPTLWKRADKAWIAVVAIILGVAIFLPQDLVPTLTFAGTAFGHTAVFIAGAVLAVGWLKATGAEAMLARAFEGRETRMILLAALFGGLSPFCSCEVIPFVSALLAVGAPLSAVMAFWLSSPLMDPAMFLVTAGTLGTGFAVAKTIAAVGIGLAGGFGTMALARSAIFTDPLKAAPKKSCCGCGPNPLSGKPHWRFWDEPARRSTFREAVVSNALFLGKWLLLAYLIEALMVSHIPAEWIAGALGGDGVGTVLLGALLGGPAYLNGYAAVPLIAGLTQQGMAQGAAMSFVIAGGVSCIPAAVAVWALVKPRVFAAYLGYAFAGSIIAGLVWGMVA
jgi:uncharacterized membrane protein YraQ (UPF0718 family)